MASSPQHHENRKRMAKKYALRLKQSPTVSVSMWDRRYFNSSLHYNRTEMKKHLIERITDELGKEFLQGRTVSVHTVYDMRFVPDARKLRKATISLVEPVS